MNKETVDSIINAIKPVAEKIGEGAAHLYEIYTRQMFVEGLVGLIITGFFLLICVILWGFTVASFREKEPDEDKQIVLGAISSVLTIIVMIGASLTFTSNITKIINPEYHAVQRILETVKGQ